MAVQHALFWAAAALRLAPPTSVKPGGSPDWIRGTSWYTRLIPHLSFSLLDVVSFVTGVRRLQTDGVFLQLPDLQ